MRELRAAGDLLAYADENRELHALIVRMAGHHTAATLLQRLRLQSVSFQYRTILRPGRADRSIEEHEALANAIIARDPVAAEAAMRRHLDAAVAALKDAIASSRAAARPRA